jgi:predicted metal-dependent hydrolase
MTETPAQIGDRDADATVVQGGRVKAYRPMPADERLSALAAGLGAYHRGDAFLAHELLEPAWMGTRDAAERELLQGLIKLAAAFVHAARGNPAGVAKNLRGARDRLANAADADNRARIDVSALIALIDRRLAAPIDIHDAPIPIPMSLAISIERRPTRPTVPD